MSQQHSSHAQMSTEMERRHYKMLALNLMVSLVIMYLVMFTMIWSFSEFFNNLNMLYMTLMMVTPMGVLMLLMMGSMYRNRRWNVVLYATFAAVFALSFYAMRDQSLVGDRQFLRSMIPHHSGAVLMCQRASIEDQELRELCANIIASQTQEIEQMERMLANHE
jgi:hypothetical protein